jgi:serine/threonine protein kinase
MSDKGNPVLIDFDFSRLDARGTATLQGKVIGSHMYIDPAILTDIEARKRPSYDLYAFGVICSEILLGKRCNSPQEIPQSGLAVEVKNLLKGLLNQDPKARMTLKDVLANDFVRGMLKCLVCQEWKSIGELSSCSPGEQLNESSHSVCKECFKAMVSYLLSSFKARVWSNAQHTLHASDSTQIKMY